MYIRSNKSDHKTIQMHRLFSYMNLARKLQVTYRMEPAGSQGVWALDDYQFVAFIWGAAQFIGHPRLKPKSIPDYDMAEGLAKDYHFSACIKYISQVGIPTKKTIRIARAYFSMYILLQVKTGPFPEHSNQLWNISSVATWEKVNSGLIKMYRAEVLSKFPVIQHVFFGSLFTLEESQNPIPYTPAPPRGIMPPRMSGTTVPPMGVMPPRLAGAVAPGTTMPPMGVMPPRLAGSVAPGSTVPPMRVMPPRLRGTMVPPRAAAIPPGSSNEASSDQQPAK